MNLQFISRIMTLLFLWLVKNLLLFLWLLKNLVQGWVSRPAENLITDLKLVGLGLTQDKLLQLKPGKRERGIINI